MKFIVKKGAEFVETHFFLMLFVTHFYIRFHIVIFGLMIIEELCIFRASKCCTLGYPAIIEKSVQFMIEIRSWSFFHIAMTHFSEIHANVFLLSVIFIEESLMSIILRTKRFKLLKKQPWRNFQLFKIICDSSDAVYDWLFWGRKQS